MRAETPAGASGYGLVVSALRPIMRTGFPGRGAILRNFINDPAHEDYWSKAGLRWVKGDVHGYDMPCDLSIFTGRIAFFLRRWNEADTQSILLTLLKPGDTFVDIGANVGMATLTAARAVGPAGRIVAYEPNPEVAAILDAAVRRNGLENVDVRQSAIGPKAGRTSLFVPEANHGEASLGAASGSTAGRSFEIAIEDGSRLAELDRCDFIKIDVEGYEAHVVDAISETIATLRPLVSTEVIARHLERCGSTVEHLARSFDRLSYTGFRYFNQAAGLRHFRAKLEPFEVGRLDSDTNVLWVPSERSAAVRDTEFVRIRR
ncbi:hypothetical protein GCM10023264_13650 [Sphingomonas daechungensis]